MRGDAATPWLLLTPALLITTLIVLFPAAQTVWMSLHQVVLFRPRVSAVRRSGQLRDRPGRPGVLAEPLYLARLGHHRGRAAIPARPGRGVAAHRRFGWRGLARALIVVPWALPSVIIGLIWSSREPQTRKSSLPEGLRISTIAEAALAAHLLQ